MQVMLGKLLHCNWLYDNIVHDKIVLNVILLIHEHIDFSPVTLIKVLIVNVNVRA